MNDDDIVMYRDVPPTLPNVGDIVPVLFKRDDDTWDSLDVVVTDIDDDGTIHIESLGP